MTKLNWNDIDLWANGAGRTKVPDDFENGVIGGNRYPARDYNYLVQELQKLGRQAFASRLKRFHRVDDFPFIGIFGRGFEGFVGSFTGGALLYSPTGAHWSDTGQTHAQGDLLQMGEGIGGVTGLTADGYAMDWGSIDTPPNFIDTGAVTGFKYAHGGADDGAAVAITAAAGGIRYASDYRGTWAAASSPPSLGGQNIVDVSYLGPDGFCLVTSGGGFSRSVDGGDTWSALATIPTCSQTFGVAAYGNKVAVSGVSSGSVLGVFFTDNLGASWSFVQLGDATTTESTLREPVYLGNSCWMVHGLIKQADTLVNSFSLALLSQDDCSTWEPCICFPDNNVNGSAGADGIASGGDGVLLRLSDQKAYTC